MWCLYILFLPDDIAKYFCLQNISHTPEVSNPTMKGQCWGQYKYFRFLAVNNSTDGLHHRISRPSSALCSLLVPLSHTRWVYSGLSVSPSSVSLAEADIFFYNILALKSFLRVFSYFKTNVIKIPTMMRRTEAADVRPIIMICPSENSPPLLLTNFS